VWRSSSSSLSRPTSGDPSRRSARAVEREPVRPRADEDLVRACSLLEAGGDVDRVAGGEGGVEARVRDDLARLDADPRLEPEVADGVEDRAGGPDGAGGVVLVRAWDPERGHDRVADELLHGAAVGADAP